MDEIIIRKMTEEDIPDIMKIEMMSFSTPWSKYAFLNEIYKPYSLTKVALLKDNLVGYICVNLIVNEGHILNLATHPEFRRQGIGTRLMKEVLKELKDKGCRFVYLEVRLSSFWRKEIL